MNSPNTKQGGGSDAAEGFFSLADKLHKEELVRLYLITKVVYEVTA